MNVEKLNENLDAFYKSRGDLLELNKIEPWYYIVICKKQEKTILVIENKIPSLSDEFILTRTITGNSLEHCCSTAMDFLQT